MWGFESQVIFNVTTKSPYGAQVKGQNFPKEECSEKRKGSTKFGISIEHYTF